MRIALVLLAGVALLGAAAADAAKRKTVRIYDNYFVPDTLRIKRNTVVAWRWPAYDEAGDVHDVKLNPAPKGVKKFRSEPPPPATRTGAS